VYLKWGNSAERISERGQIDELKLMRVSVGEPEGSKKAAAQIAHPGQEGWLRDQENFAKQPKVSRRRAGRARTIGGVTKVL